MIKIFTTFVTFLLLCSNAGSQVRLNEALFNPTGPDSGYEWIELYNSSASQVDLSGYSISWGTDAYLEGYDFPAGTVIAANDYLLLGGPSSDSINYFPCYDLVYDFDSLHNGGLMGFGAASGIALFDIPFASIEPGPFGTVPIDAVIYNGINSNGLLDEMGNSANNVDVPVVVEGESVVRTGDTTWAVSVLPDPQNGGLNTCGCIGFQEGDPCDDADPLTVNDTLDANCNCAGVSNCLVYPCGGSKLTDNIKIIDDQPVTDGRYITWISETVQDLSYQIFGIYLFDTENPAAGIKTIKLDIQEKYVPDIKDGYIVWEEKNDTSTHFWYYDIVQDTAVSFASYPVTTPGNQFPRTCQGQIVWAIGDSVMHYDIQNPIFNGTTLTNAGSQNSINGLKPVTNGSHIAWRELAISGTIKGHVFLYDLQNPVFGGSQITTNETNVISLQLVDSLLVWNSASGLNFDAEVYLYDLENTGLGVQQITNNTNIHDAHVHTDGNNLVWSRGPNSSREQLIFYDYPASGPQDTLFTDTLNSVEVPKVQGEKVVWLNDGQLLFIDKGHLQQGIQKLATNLNSNIDLFFSGDLVVWADKPGNENSEIFYYILADSLVDQDGDGFCNLWDCDDNDGSFYPGASCVDSLCGSTGIVDTNCLCQADSLLYDECSGAWVLPLNDTLIICNTYATGSPVPYPPSGCFSNSYNGGDVWLKFNAPTCTGTFNLEIGISDSDLEQTNMLLYSGSCGSLNFIDCEQTSTGDTTAVLFNLTDIPCGDSTYFLRIFDSNNDDFGKVDVFVNTEECSHPDFPALKAFYLSTGGTNWIDDTGWDTTGLAGCDPCSWFGITCNGSGRVSKIIMFENGLSGSLPPELGELDSLNTLRLTKDNLSGNIPPELGSLSKLASIDLRSNQLLGGIPPELGNLVNLYELILSKNMFTDSIPPALGNLHNLNDLRLDQNNLVGGLPPELGMLHNIEYFAVHDNDLGGCYPLELDTLCTFLSNSENNTNELISDGNNFDAPWENFCNSLAGVCDTNMICQHPDYEVLMTLYDSTGGPGWTNNTGWVEGKAGTDCNPCSWFGVLCNGDGRVIRLSLGANNLSGIIPGELSSLTELEELFLFNNNLSGGIPPSFDLLPLISIRLQINNLNGNIPASLGNIFTLENLELGSNQFSGSLPSSLGNLSNLVNLSVFNNQLSGPLPTTLGNLGELKFLNLNGNNFQDTLPDDLSNLTKLETLALGSNQLTGPIPESFGQLTSLVNVNLSGNQLTGPIPDTVAQWQQLTILRLQGNQLSGNLSPALAELPNLNNMTIAFNQLSGCYSSELGVLCSQLGANSLNSKISNGNNFDAPWEDFCASGAGECVCHPDLPPLLALYDSTGGPGWTNNTGWVDGKAGINCDPCSWFGVTCDGNTRVTQLALFSNNLVGKIPDILDSLSNLTVLSFANNQLSGEVPPELGNLDNLTLLNLSNNQLSGSIPPELGSLDSLKTLAIASNQLSDTIPAQLGNLSELTNLTLNDNQLSGAIPPELGNLQELQFLFLYDNQLSGPLPPELGNLTAMQQFRLSNNQLTGSIPSGYSNMANLTLFWLNQNDLSGCFPPELDSLCDVNSVALQDNPGLPGGGDWGSFCNSGEGACPPPGCPDTLLLTNHFVDSTYEAADTVTSIATINAGLTITYQAGTEVRLLPDFHAQRGSDFLAIIDTCGVPPSTLAQTYWGSRKEEKEKILPPPVSPQEISLQAYPNPARQRSILQYYLPTNGNIRLEVYDLTGRPLQILQNGFVSAGLHRTDWLLPIGFEGLCLVRLRTNDDLVVRRVMVIK